MAYRVDNIGFGELKLIQDPEEFCYGVDAVLLSDFAARSEIKKADALDLGTNTGIIPMILSHKTDWHITGVEVQTKAWELAVENVKMNALESRIEHINSDVLNIEELLSKSSYDVITCNPPYTENFGGMKSENTAKMIARHETTATLEDFIRVSASLLKPRGSLFMVHRPSRMVDIFTLGRKYKLEPKELRLVSPRDGETPNILLVRMIRGAGKELLVQPSFSVYNTDGSYTKELLEIYER